MDMTDSDITDSDMTDSTVRLPRTDKDQTDLLYELMPYARQLGAEVVSSAPATVRLRLGWRKELCTSGDLMHGGVIMGVADSCGGICAFLNLPPGARGTATIESKTNFLRPVRAGHVDAVARPLHLGRNYLVIDVDVLDDEGALVARVTQTQAILWE